MIGSILVVSALALQGAPATKTAPKPAAPIAVVADTGPTVEVPAELAALTGPDTIAVIYLPDAGDVDKLSERLKEAMGPVGEGMPIGNSVKQFLKQSIRTDLDIPMNQPLLWWIDMPAASGDEPPMGMGEVVFRQAMRIPGAEAAMEKAKADAAASGDPKTKPTMPIRAKARRSSVSVLKGDLVVLSSEMDPFRAPEKPQPSALLKGLPMAAACGRVDLSRVMAEQGDQLRMVGGFAAAALAGGGDAADAKLTDAEKRQRAMKQQLADAAGKQIDATVDALMQLKRATFAAALQGDDFTVWADWSRDAAFPKGLSASTVHALASRLPKGMPVYVGISTNAMSTIYGDKVTIDDALATLGSTPEQAKAYEAAVAKSREVLEMIEDGFVGGVSMSGFDSVGMGAFKVKDAKAFRGATRAALEEMNRSGLAEIKVAEEGELMTVTIVPSAVRVQEIMEVFAPGAGEAEAVKQATVPTTLALRFKGNEVLITQQRGDKPVDPATLVREDAHDMRTTLAAKTWGAADWFGVIDLRHIMAEVSQQTAEAMNRADPKGDAARRSEAAASVRKGKPMLLRLWQGVQGSTARLTIDVNLADWKRMVEDVENARKAAVGGDKDGDGDEKPAAAATDDPT